MSQGQQNQQGGQQGQGQGGPLEGVTDQVGQATQGVQDTAGQAAGQVQETAGGAVDQVSQIAENVAPGTQPSTIIRLRNHGMPRIDRSGRGDLHIVIAVEVPTKLSKRAKELVVELEEELRNSGTRKAARS